MIPLCKDCCFSNTTWWQRFWKKYPSFLRCKHVESWALADRMLPDAPDSPDYLINGESPSLEPSFCGVMRMKHNPCGSDGKLFRKRI